MGLKIHGLKIHGLKIKWSENPHKQITMQTAPVLKLNLYSIKFSVSQRTINYYFLEKYFNFILKSHCYKHFSKKLCSSCKPKFFNSLSLSLRLFNLLTIYVSSSLLKSSRGIARENVGIRKYM